jgi:hypothetical protein
LVQCAQVFIEIGDQRLSVDVRVYIH